MSYDIAILFVLSALLLAPSIALGEVTLTYSGETGETGSGIGSYSGDHSSIYLWDYVYDLSATSADGPFYWGIATPYDVDSVYNPTYTPGDTGAWAGAWDNLIEAGDYEHAFEDTSLEGQAGVVWTWFGTGTPLTGTFHYLSEYAPVRVGWAAEGTGTDYDGAGLEWSASPEPASMALYGLSLLGVGFWRRRKKTA